MPIILELPEIIELSEYNGNIHNYMNAIYEVFRRDFVLSKPNFKGKRLGLKKFPLVAGKEYTFYHFTHDGKNENDREPNLRRMERMPFPRPMIDCSNCESLRVWRVKRGSKERILIFHEEESYLVVLEDRGSYILPWTAYLVEYPNKRRRLIKEYEAYISAEAAQ